MHVFDDNDLALLAADFGAPVPTLELAAADEPIAKLDEVFVLGFPPASRSSVRPGRVLGHLRRRAQGRGLDLHPAHR